jgi:hypothetical protein
MVILCALDVFVVLGYPFLLIFYWAIINEGNSAKKYLFIFSLFIIG